MNRRIFNLLFISFVICCLVMGLLGGVARAQQGTDLTRKGQAYEQERRCIGTYCFVTGRQWTSPYDIMRGEYYADITFSYAGPNINMLTNPFAPATEYSYEGSAIGGFTPPMFQFPVSGLSYMIATMGAPQAQIYEAAGPFTGNISYQAVKPGFGFAGSGMLGPFFSMMGVGQYLGGQIGQGLGYGSAMGAIGQLGTGLLGGGAWYSGVPSLWNPYLWQQQQRPLPTKIY